MNTILLKYDDFSLPNKEHQMELFKNYEELESIKVIPRNFNFQLSSNLNIAKYQLDLQFGKDKSYYVEMNNLIAISKHYLTHLWYLSKQKPNRFGGGKATANSISFETYYEIIYSKLSSAFDRYLHLINIYFDINEPKISKEKVGNFFKKYKEKKLFTEEFQAIVNDEDYKNIVVKRNLFIHNESIFDKYFKLENDQWLDNYDYDFKMHETIKEFITFVKFLNTKALPFLDLAEEFINVKCK